MQGTHNEFLSAVSTNQTYFTSDKAKDFGLQLGV